MIVLFPQLFSRFFNKLSTLCQCIIVALLYFATINTWAQQCVNSPGNIVAWWKFDESSGLTAIDSINNHDGTLISNPIRVSGVVANALDFDGFNDRVVVPDNSILDIGLGDFSIEGWVRTADLDGAIISKTIGTVINDSFEGYVLFLQQGQPGVTIGPVRTGISVVSSTPINDNQWHHIALTFARASASGGAIYVDGQKVLTFGTTPLNGINIRASSVLNIGIQPDSFITQTGPFNGQLDEITLYDHALSPVEINNIFTAGTAGKCAMPLFDLQVSLNCIVETTFFDTIGATCFGDAIGGTGNYQFIWNYLGEGDLSTFGSNALINNCSGEGTVFLTVNDGSSVITDALDIRCDNGGFGF